MSSVGVAVIPTAASGWLVADSMPEVNYDVCRPKTASLFVSIAHAREDADRGAMPSVELDDLLNEDGDPELSMDIAREMDSRWDD